MNNVNTLCTVSPDDAKKLRHSAGTDEGAVRSAPQTSNVGENINVLSGVICLVGLDINDECFASVNASLLSLGATISPSFGEHLTHFITIQPSLEAADKLNKRILAAELLDIFVVSVEWLEQCKCTNQKASELDFRITSSLSAVVRATKQGLIQNQSTTSLHVDQQNCNRLSGDANNPSRFGRASSHHSIANIEELERVIYDDTDTMLSTINNPTTATADKSAASVPMPTFREYIPPVVPQRVLETVAKRRRSERISDLVSDTESETESKEEEDDVSKRQKMESWDYVQSISIDSMLPIVFLPGREGDKLPPFVLHKGANAYSTTKNGGSGIQGLNANGKKTSSDNGSAYSSSSIKNKSGNTSNAKDSTSSKTKDSKDTVAVPKIKLVIAYTGFDDKHGERSTLVQTLRQLIKTIKRRVADGDVVITPIIDNTITGCSGKASDAMEVEQPDGEDNIASGNKGNPSSTSLNSLEGGALSPDSKKKRGRPRGGSTTSRDSNNNINNNNSTNEKNQAVDVTVGSADKRVRGRSRNSSAADIQDHMSSTHNSTVATTTTTSPSKKKHTTTTESSCIVPEEMIQITGWQIEALECSVSILSNQSDFSAASCTHVIVNANSSARTLRRLFAMARGVCLVTQEWVTSSVSSQSWANVGHHLHPTCAAMFRNMRDKLGMVIKDRIPRADVFRGIKVCVVDSTNPPLETLTDLVQAAGAVICYQIGERNVQLTVFGDASAAYDWTVRMAKKRRPWSNKAVADVKALAENGKCVTAKFVFNCIGEGKLRAPIQGDGELISLDNLLGNVTSDPPKKSNPAKNAAQSDATTMENDNEYCFLDNNTTTTSVRTSTRRSRHSLGAESETVVDLTEDHPAPGPSTTSSSGKKLTPAEERLQRQLSNEFLPNQFTKGKNNTKNSDVVGDSSAATDANSISTKRSSTTAPNNTTNITTSTAATTAPKSAIASLLGSWIEVRFYGYGMRRSKALTAGLPAVGEDINYTPMYTNHKLISKSAPSTAKKNDNTSVTTQNDIGAGNDSTSDAIMEKSTTTAASAILPSVSTTINNSSTADCHSTSSAISHVDNNTDEVTTSKASSGPTSAAPSNTVNAATTIASPIVSPLTRSNTLCDDVPPFSYPDDTGTDTGTAQSSAAPTPLRTKSIIAHNNTFANGDKDTSIQAYQSNTQLVVDSLLELSRTSRKSDKPSQKSVTSMSSSGNSKGNTTGAEATISTPASTTTAVLGHNPDVSVHDSATFSRIQSVAASKPTASATTITTMKASKIRSSSTSSDGRRGSVFTITVPYQPAPVDSTAAASAIPTTDVAQDTIKDVMVDTMDIAEPIAGSTTIAVTNGASSQNNVAEAKASTVLVCTLESPQVIEKQQAVLPGPKSVDTVKSEAAAVSIPVPVRSPVAIKITTPQSAAVTNSGGTTATSATTEPSVAADSVPLVVTVPDATVPEPILVPASIPVSLPVSVPVPVRHPLQASLPPAATSHSYSNSSSSSKLLDHSSNSSNSNSDKDTSGKKVDFKDHVQSDFSGKGGSDRSVVGSSTSESGKSIMVQAKSADPKQIHGSPSVKNSVSNERRVSYSMSLVAPDTVTDNKNSNVGVSPNAKACTTGAALSNNPSIQLSVNSAGSSSGGTPGRSAPYVPIKITTNSSTAGGATTISTNRGLATSQRFSLPTRLSDANPLKRKSQFVDPYQGYDTSGNKLNKGSAGNILYAHTNTNSIYNASSTPQLSHGAYNTNIVKPIAKNRNNSILEDDIQTDDSSQEKRKNDQASLRGRVGGTAPFRSSYPPAASYNSGSGNSVSGHNRNPAASTTNTINPINSSHHSTNTASYSTSNRNSLPSSSTSASNRDYSRPTPVNTNYNYHSTNSNNYHNHSTNSSVVTSSHHAGTPQAQPQQYRTNSNIYMRRSPLLSPSPNAHSTSSANHTPNSAYTANTSKKSNLHAPRLSSSNLAALTSHTSVGPAAKGLLIKKGKPVRSTTENSALNSANLAILGSRTTNPLNDAASDAESEQLIFTPASQNTGVAVNKG